VGSIERTALIAPDEPGAVEIVNPGGDAPFILTGDHAGNAVPRALADLGLSPEDLARHIGWDIGAAGVARRLAPALGATAVLARYSRLIIDPNRAIGEAASIPAVSDGTSIPANAILSWSDVIARAKTFYWPYHEAIDVEIGRLRLMGKEPAVVAIHSFTPALSTTGAARPWHVGVMFSHDDRLGRALITALRQDSGLVVGENEPYSGFTLSYAQKLHGLAQMLPHAQIEVRQDLIATPEGQAAWADRLARILSSLEF
jgi:predicted N-formylglutamate amidohydrolase